MKSIFASKTFWVNIVALVATISTAFGLDLGLDPDKQVAVVGGIMSLVNIVLRFITKDAVSVTG